MDITYNDIRIRNAEKKDCHQIADWWNDVRLMKYVGFPNGLGKSAKDIEEQIANDSDTTSRLLVIEYKGKLIGEANFHVYADAKYGIGIKIGDANYRGKGLGRLALSMLIEELFKQGATLISLDTDLENTRAQHVYEMVGFKKTGIHKDSWTDQLGKLRSSVDYELIASEFRNLKAEE